MLNKSLSGFIQDERGSYTIWSVAWFMIYVGIGGLAVDATDVYRHETLLQATADSAALAGVMSLPNETDAVDQALAYAQDNMQRTSHGTVLAATDVKLGTWSFDERTFYTGGTAAPNAVYVTTRREESNSNPLRMNMLRFLSLAGGGDLWWNVNAEAVAVRGVSSCHNNGMIAGGRLMLETQNDFGEDMCLHGVEGMKVTKINTFAAGVSTSTGCEGQGCVNNGPNGLDGAMDNDGFPPAWDIGGGYSEPLQPFGAASVDSVVYALRNLVPGTDAYSDFNSSVITAAASPELTSLSSTDFSGWTYMWNPGAAPILKSYGPGETGWQSEVVLEDGETAAAFTIYEIDCAGSSGITLPGGRYEYAAIIANCPISAPTSVTLNLNNVVLASTWEPPKPWHFGIKFSADANLGGAGKCDSAGVELYTTASSIKFAASGDIHDTQIFSAYDVEFAANTDGDVGVHIEAQNDIRITSRSTFGLCDGVPNGAKAFTYRLMQ